MLPTDLDTIKALRRIGKTLDATCAYHLRGRFFFPLSGGWALALSPDDAGRFRVEAWCGSRVRATLWSLARDERRLADLALSLRAEVESLTEA